MIKEKQTEKQLSSQLQTVQGEIDALFFEVCNKQRELEQKKKTAQSLKEKIKQLSTAIPSQPKVSEHALLRYFERVKGYDLEAIKSEILSPEVLRIVGTLGGTGTYPNATFSLKMKDNVVVTII